MDLLNLSDFTDAPASSNSAEIVSLGEISLLDHELHLIDNMSSFMNDSEYQESNEDVFVTDRGTSFISMDENEEEEEENHNQIALVFDDSSMMEESLIFDLASSFPDNLGQSFESFSAAESFMSGSSGEFPEVSESTTSPFRLPFSHCLHSRKESSIFSARTHHSERSIQRDEEQEKGSSAPYAQLCFDRKRKSLVSMLEIDIVNGRRRHHSRLPLDSPNTDDFPWLRQDTATKLLTSPPGDESETTDSTISQKMSFSSSSSDGSFQDENEEEEDSEPIILSGWMIHHEEMSEEEADIYWLLNDGNDVWVKVDDGCGKALKKIWTSCSHWKPKRSILFHQPSNRSVLFHQPSRNEQAEDHHNKKRLCYSVL